MLVEASLQPLPSSSYGVFPCVSVCFCVQILPFYEDISHIELGSLCVKIHKISALDTPNQPLIRIKKLSDSVYGTLKYFCKTKEHHDVGWLLLMSLNKVVKDKDELRNLNFQNKCYLHYPRASRCSRKTVLSPGALGLKLLNIKHRTSSCHCMNYNVN